MSRHFGIKSRVTAGGPQPGSHAQNTPRDLDDPFATILEARENSFNEAALIFCLIIASAIIVGLVALYVVLRAVGL